jgi:hypothetical protein
MANATGVLSYIVPWMYVNANGSVNITSREAIEHNKGK